MNRILFEKTGMAKYISHLDLMRTMQRALIRAGFEIKHTQGFNPHPHMVFALPLPVGCESVCEIMDFELIGEKSDKEIVDGLNNSLPEGIRVLDAYTAERKLKELSLVEMEITYIYDREIGEAEADKLRELFSGQELIVNKKTKKGYADINILEMIDKIEISVYNKDEIKIGTVIAAQNPSLNPLLITAAVQNYAPEVYPDQVSYMRKAVFDNNKDIFK
ncbi:MAG: DUF2344 domain-containing protein [Ruminococcaceae bacterium]|nr:DUF2344 domain-containing protein [Oscillospiraceae bacterium]